MIRSWRSTNVRPWLALLAIVLAILVPLAWYLGSPLFVDRRVDESFPIGAVPAKAPLAEARSKPAELTRLSRGQFGTIDAVHKGAGTATLFTRPGGQGVLRFDDFRVTNGPDLYVYLSGHPAPRDSRQLHEGGALEVARLKGNVGDQNYELPADLDLAKFRSAVIYCKQFGVVFSTAELVAAS